MATENAASQLGLAFAMFSLRCCNCGSSVRGTRKGLAGLEGMGANEHRRLLHVFRVGRFDDVRNPLAKKDDSDTGC
jgi:hypothetical protein